MVSWVPRSRDSRRLDEASLAILNDRISRDLAATARAREACLSFQSIDRSDSPILSETSEDDGFTMSMYEIELDVWLDFDDDSLYVNREGFPAEEPALRR